MDDLKVMSQIVVVACISCHTHSSLIRRGNHRDRCGSTTKPEFENLIKQALLQPGAH